MVNYRPTGLGEHKIVVKFTDGTSDIGVFNVTDSVAHLLRDRVDYLCEKSYSGETGKVPFSFSPISNQGESLGKLTFILQECLLDEHISDRVPT